MTEKTEFKRPMLASDLDLAKIKYPVIVQTKVDGCRLMHTIGKATGRSLKPYKNKFTTQRLSHEMFKGLDGEAFVGTDMYAQSLCRDTTSALNSIKGEPVITWAVFDDVEMGLAGIPYIKRMQHLFECVKIGAYPEGVITVPFIVAKNEEELIAFEAQELAKGAEGIIIRDPNGPYKQGRSTIKEGGLLRLKRFEDKECRVIGIKEGNKNTNEAKKNELGQTERSSHQENMIPNGQVGTLLCEELDGSAKFNVSPGEMTEAECIYYFNNPSEIVGKTITFSHFPKGKKEGSDAYRFPVFKNIRASEDMS